MEREIHIFISEFVNPVGGKGDILNISIRSQVALGNENECQAQLGGNKGGLQAQLGNKQNNHPQPDHFGLWQSSQQ
jgi:hypothetical protein